MSFNVGDAYLQILPSFQGVADAIDKQAAQWGTSAGKSFATTFSKTVKDGTNGANLGPSDGDLTKQGSSAGGKFADSFKARVEAALESLPDVNVDANTSEADAKVAQLRSQLEELSGKTIGINITEGEAVAQITTIKAQLDELAERSPSIRVQVDTAAASAQLAAFEAEAAAAGTRDGGAFADGFKARTEEALRSLPDVEIHADSSDADRQIAAVRAELEELSGKTIGVDLDEGDAVAKIAALQAELDQIGAESPSVQVQVDTARASAQLAAFTAEVEAVGSESPDVHVGDDGSIGAVGGEISGLGVALISLATLAAPIGAALTAAFAGIATTLGAVAGAAGVAALGFSGVSKTVGLLGQQQKDQASSGQASTSSLNQQASAAAQVASAERSLQEAVANADADSVNSAERVKQARQSLADAEQQAAAQRAEAEKAAAQKITEAEQQVKQADQGVQQAQQSLADAERESSQQRISDAEAVKSAQQGVADAVRSASQQQIQDAESVKNAQQGVTAAEQQAAQQAVTDAQNVKSAEEGVAQAQGQSLAAQQALNDAREQAARDLESYADKAADAGLNVQQSQIDLTSAQNQLTTDTAPGSTATPLQVQQDQLNVAKAQQSLTEAQQASTEATQDNNKAQAEGVNGAPGVIAAKQQITQATAAQKQAEQTLAAARKQETADAKTSVAAVQKAEQALADAERQQRQDEISGNEQVKNARQSLTDAIRQQKNDEVSSAEAIRKAEQQVTQAIQAQTEAQKKLTAARNAPIQTPAQQNASNTSIRNAKQGVSSAVRDQRNQNRQGQFSVTSAQNSLTAAKKAQSTAGAASDGGASSALAGVDAQLAKVNPATLQFAKYVQGTLEPALDNLKGAAAAGLLPGVEQGLNTLIQKNGPAITQFVSHLGGVLGDLARDAGKALTSPFWTQFFQWVSSTAGPTIKTFAGIVGNLAKGFGGILEAFSPVTSALGKGLEDLTGKFADFGAQAGNKNSPFQSFLAYVQQNGPVITDIFGKLADILGKLFTGLAPLGSVMLKALDAFVGFVSQLSPTELFAIAGGIAAIWAALGGPVTAIAIAAVAAAALIVAHWSQIKPAIQPVLDVLSDVWAFIKNNLVPVLEGVLLKALQGVQDAIHIVGDALDAHKQQWLELEGAIETVANFIIQNVLPLLGPVLKTAFEVLGTEIGIAIDVIAGLITAFTDIVKAGTDTVNWLKGPFVNAFKTAWSDVSGTVSTVVGDVVGFFKSLPGDITSAISNGEAALKKVGDTIVGDVLAGIKAAANFGGQVVSWISGAITGAISGAAAFGHDIGSSVVGGIRDGVEAVTGFGVSVIKWVSTAISGALTAAANWGSPIGSSIITAIRTAVEGAVGFGSDIVAWFRKTIGDALGTAAGWASKIGSTIVSDIQTAITTAANFGSDIAGWLSRTIKTGATSIASDFEAIGTAIVHAIARGVDAAGDAVSTSASGIWDKVKKVFEDGINFVIDNILDPLRSVLNTALGVFGVKIPKIPDVNFSDQAGAATAPGKAGGGVFPGYAPGRDSILARMSPGEGVLVPEAVRGIGGASGVQAINSMFSARVSPPAFAGGGVLGTLGSIGGSILGDITGGLTKLLSLARAGAADAAVGVLTTLEAPLRTVLGHAPDFAKTLGGGLLDTINADVKTFISGHHASAPAKASGPIPTGQHKTLIDEALKDARVPVTVGNEAAVNLIVNFESGWNPNAINLTDSNAAAGHPSQGLMQTIPSTFESYRLGSLPDNIDDPIANMVAGIRYAIARYGSLGSVPGVEAVNSGGAYVGYDSGGWLMPGVTAAQNLTRKPEAVLTGPQMEALSAAAASPGMAFPKQVTLVDQNGSILAQTRMIAKDVMQTSNRGTAKIVSRALPGRGGSV